MSLLFDAGKYVPVVMIGLLPIVNPLSTVPLFLSLTKNMEAERRKVQARRACLYAFLILVAFLLIGNSIIALFGISLAGIRVAGGLIILVLSFRMLFSGESEEASLKASASEIKQVELDYSFSPLAIPSLSGPGSIATVMSYGSQIPDNRTLVGYIVVVTGIALTIAIAYGALLGATWIARFLGSHGIQAVTKIMGFLLACVAVQFIASGVRDFIAAFS